MTRGPFSRGPRGEKTIVQKLLTDNFKNLPPEAKYFPKIQGLTWEGWLIQDRRLWESGEISMGKNYKQRGDECAGEVSAAKRIKVLSEDEECDDILL